MWPPSERESSCGKWIASHSQVDSLFNQKKRPEQKETILQNTFRNRLHHLVSQIGVHRMPMFCMYHPSTLRKIVCPIPSRTLQVPALFGPWSFTVAHAPSRSCCEGVGRWFFQLKKREKFGSEKNTTILPSLFFGVWWKWWGKTMCKNTMSSSQGFSLAFLLLFHRLPGDLLYGYVVP